MTEHLHQADQIWELYPKHRQSNLELVTDIGNQGPVSGTELSACEIGGYLQVETVRTEWDLEHPAGIQLLAGGWGILPDLVSEAGCDRPVRETEFEVEFIFFLYLSGS